MENNFPRLQNMLSENTAPGNDEIIIDMVLYSLHTVYQG